MNNRAIFIVIIVVIIITTIPRLFLNYGADGDAVRNVKAADAFFENGDYAPSRLPGNPLFEYLLTVIHPWSGNIGTNSLVFIFYVVSVIIFFKIGEYQGLNNISLLTIIYASVPIVLKNSANTMDYLPGLSMMLISYLSILRGKTVLSGIFLGLAIGFRLSNAIFIIPITLLMYIRGFALKNILLQVTYAIIIGIGFYIPIFLKVGWQMFVIPPSIYTPGTYFIRTMYQGVRLFGILSTLVIIVFLVKKWKNILNLIKNSYKDAGGDVLVEFVTIVIFILLFIIHSDDTDYLIPCIPFLLFLFSRIFTNKELIFIGICLISYAFVDIDLKGGTSGRRELRPNVSWGIVVDDFTKRLEMEQIRNNIYKLGSSERSVIITGMGPILTYRNSNLDKVSSTQLSTSLIPEGIVESGNWHRISNSNTYLIYALSKENVIHLQKLGYVIYYFAEDAPTILINRYHYDPSDVNMKPIATHGPNAFWKKI